MRHFRRLWRRVCSTVNLCRRASTFTFLATAKSGQIVRDSRGCSNVAGDTKSPDGTLATAEKHVHTLRITVIAVKHLRGITRRPEARRIP